MCGFTVDLIDFDEMSDTQRKTLVKNLQRKKNALKSQLELVNESLKGIDRCLKVIDKKTKRRASVNQHRHRCSTGAGENRSAQAA